LEYEEWQVSIYVVQLAEWYPLGDEKHGDYTFTLRCVRCLACGGKCKFNKAVGHHSIVYGYGDLWCTWKCHESGKVARPDKRRERRLNRKYNQNVRLS
jgi:hypothetical protein